MMISVPRARLNKAEGERRNGPSQVLSRYVRMTKQIEAVIAGAYICPAPILLGAAGTWS